MQELSLNIMDISQNSVSAGATLMEFTVVVDSALSTMEFTLTDNGKGMSEEMVASVQSPFFTTRTTRKVGLGVPLFKMAAEMTGGRFSIASTLGKGTVVTAFFHTDHIDMTPLGDVDGTIKLLVACNPDMDIYYRYEKDGQALVLDTRELREQLGEVPLDDPAVTMWIAEYIQEQREALG